MNMDYLKLIGEVEKRPYLWKIPKGKRINKKLDILWKQVSKRVGSSESSCRARWTHLRFLYISRKKRAEKNPDYKKSWEYWEHLKFLDDRIITSKKGKFNVHEMIAKVKERPYLWKVPKLHRKKNKAAKLWNEIAEHVGVSVNRCREKWNRLRWQHKKCTLDGDKCKRQWNLYEDLEFLSVVHDNSVMRISKPAQIDKFDLIAKVKETPYLWQVPANRRNINISASLWEQLADNFGIDANKCKTIWHCLRGRYKSHKKQESILLQSSEKYDCNWKYYDSMKFLSDPFDDDVPVVKIDKLDLIALVKKQPELWKVDRYLEDKQTLWDEIAKTLGADVNVCQIQWRYLYWTYRRNKRRERPESGPCTWEYYDHLKFLDAIEMPEVNEPDKVNKHDLIAKVKDRPDLWADSEENRMAKVQLWREVADLLGISYMRCKNLWNGMCIVYKKHREVEKKLLESSIKYCSKWEYYDHLKFLHNGDDKAPETVNRFALIARVKENPKLWKSNQQQSDENITTNMWKEISECLGVHEQTCRNIWMDLRLLYFKHNEKRDRLLKENPSAKYKCKWEYYDALKFLDKEAQTSGDMRELFEIDKLKLINKVKERPYLWATEPKARNKLIWNYNWSRVNESVGLTEKQCELEWNELVVLYNNEKGLIELLQQKGDGNETEKSRSGWEYFEHLKFLDSDNSDQYSKVAEDVQLLQPGEKRARLITEIRKRPYLWNNQAKGDRKLNMYLWTEVAELCGFELRLCKSKWQQLKLNYKKKYILFKAKKLDIETFRKFPNYEHFQFLNEDLDKELQLNILQNHNENFDKDTSSFDDNVSSQYSNSADTEEELSCKKSITHLESVCVKEEPQMQCSALTSVSLKSIESMFIKEEETELKEPDKSTNNISIKKEDTREGEAESNKRYNLQETDLSEGEKHKYKVKDEPISFDIFIKEEFETDFLEHQASQLEFIENTQVKEEQSSETMDRADNLYPVKNECLKVEPWMRNTEDAEFIKDLTANTFSIKQFDIPNRPEPVNENTVTCAVIKNEDIDVKPYISNWVKNREASDMEFITELSDTKEGISAVKRKLKPTIGSEIVTKNSRNSQLDNSSTDFKQDKADISKGRKRSYKNSNESKITNKRRKDNN